jgi:DNA polymerase III epsilon subunit-like protein
MDCDEEMTIQKGIQKLDLGPSREEVELARRLWGNRVTKPRPVLLRSCRPWQGYIPSMSDIIMAEAGYYLALDTETTGLPHRRPGLDNYYPYTDTTAYASSRVVQLGCALFSKEGQLTESVEWVFQPRDYDIPARATAIHGISTAEAMRTGVLPQDISEEFRRLLMRCDTIVMHNAVFDRHVLAAELHVSGLTDLAQMFFNKKWVCTMRLGVNVTRIPSHHGFKYPKLKELYEHLFEGNTFDGQHTALADATASGMCYAELLKYRPSGI